MPNYHWGKRLSRLLARHELTQKEASQIAGVAPSVFANWINGATPSNLHAVKRLTDHLNVSFTWLLTGENELKSLSQKHDTRHENEMIFEGIVHVRIEKYYPDN